MTFLSKEIKKCKVGEYKILKDQHQTVNIISLLQSVEALRTLISGNYSLVMLLKCPYCNNYFCVVKAQLGVHETGKVMLKGLFIGDNNLYKLKLVCYFCQKEILGTSYAKKSMLVKQPLFVTLRDSNEQNIRNNHILLNPKLLSKNFVSDLFNPDNSSLIKRKLRDVNSQRLIRKVINNKVYFFEENKDSYEEILWLNSYLIYKQNFCFFNYLTFCDKCGSAIGGGIISLINFKKKIVAPVGFSGGPQSHLIRYRCINCGAINNQASFLKNTDIFLITNFIKK